jgi:hypothetical protein
MSNEPMSSSRTCAQCNTEAPVTETGYTLISPKHAWRCKKRTLADGTKQLDWFCPDCWQRPTPAERTKGG